MTKFRWQATRKYTDTSEYSKKIQFEHFSKLQVTDTLENSSTKLHSSFEVQGGAHQSISRRMTSHLFRRIRFSSRIRAVRVESAHAAMTASPPKRHSLASEAPQPRLRCATAHKNEDLAIHRLEQTVPRLPRKAQTRPCESWSICCRSFMLEKRREHCDIAVTYLACLKLP